MNTEMDKYHSKKKVHINFKCYVVYNVPNNNNIVMFWGFSPGEGFRRGGRGLFPFTAYVVVTFL